MGPVFPDLLFMNQGATTQKPAGGAGAGTQRGDCPAALASWPCLAAHVFPEWALVR